MFKLQLEEGPEKQDREGWNGQNTVNNAADANPNISEGSE